MARDGAGRLSTGVPAMDDDHWALLALIAQLRAAVADGAPAAATAVLVGTLYRSSAEHFASEERLMREHRYPMASSHVAQHNRFLAQLSRWTVPTGPPAGTTGTAPAPPAVSATEVDQLEAWFTRHVEIADTPLADWLLHPRD